MQSLEVSGAVRPIYGSLGVKRLIQVHGSECDLTLAQPPQIECSYRLMNTKCKLLYVIAVIFCS